MSLQHNGSTFCVYAIPPIDFFAELMPLDYWGDFVRYRIKTQDQYHHSSENLDFFSTYKRKQDWLDLAKTANEYLKKTNKISYDEISPDHEEFYLLPMIAPQNADPHVHVALIWKQGNNGTTFVVSPFAVLDWAEEEIREEDNEVPY